MNDEKIMAARQSLIVERRVRAGVTWKPPSWRHAELHARIHLNGDHLIHARLVLYGVMVVPTDYIVGTAIDPDALEDELNDLIPEMLSMFADSSYFSYDHIHLGMAKIPAAVIAELEEHFAIRDPVS